MIPRGGVGDDTSKWIESVTNSGDQCTGDGKNGIYGQQNADAVEHFHFL